jgi:hypothetical protein
MPYVIRWPHRRAIALAASCAALLVTAAPAAADTGSCTVSVPASAPLFSVFNDTANYTLLPGGSFETGAPGWSLNNASIVPGNEPWYLDGSGDSRSLNIQPGGSATSQTVCGNDLFPSFRFFAKMANGSPTSQLHVGVNWWTGWGGGYMPLGTLNGSDFSSWQPTASLALGSLLPSWMTSVNAQFVFTADSGSSWNIDDVYVDPYAR